MILRPSDSKFTSMLACGPWPSTLRITPSPNFLWRTRAPSFTPGASSSVGGLKRDAATGRELWTHANEGPVGTRGLSYWQSDDGADKRLLYMNAGQLTAIDATTGQTITSFGDNGRVDLRVGLVEDVSTVRALQTSNPGRIYEDLIIMSLPAGGAGYASAPADIHAYNVRTEGCILPVSIREIALAERSSLRASSRSPMP